MSDDTRLTVASGLRAIVSAEREDGWPPCDVLLDGLLPMVQRLTFSHDGRR